MSAQTPTVPASCYAISSGTTVAIDSARNLKYSANQPKFDARSIREPVFEPCVSGQVRLDATESIWEIHFNLGRRLADTANSTKIHTVPASILETSIKNIAEHWEFDSRVAEPRINEIRHYCWFTVRIFGYSGKST